ncbi:DUF6155 family protein [Thiomicrospira microaerophila]|uniref:DUF6155 family protein n=1 Tax=Thiomicrospira microaerophila TaxID=406020 RepID=UPI000696A45B|nr:DUF6155 family protein [Thiomicrospira microaerophila]
MTQSELKKLLANKTQQELIKEIAYLFKTFSPVKEYYQAQTGDIHQIAEKYKDIIKKEFVYGHTRGYPKARLGTARKAVQDAKKIINQPEIIADIMLTFVESVSSYNNEFSSDSEANFTSPEGMFYDALKLLDDNNLLEAFHDRCSDIVFKATEAWGHYDSQSETFDQFFNPQPSSL